jgi:hypothetical protein
VEQDNGVAVKEMSVSTEWVGRLKALPNLEIKKENGASLEVKALAATVESMNLALGWSSIFAEKIDGLNEVNWRNQVTIWGGQAIELNDLLRMNMKMLGNTGGNQLLYNYREVKKIVTVNNIFKTVGKREKLIVDADDNDFENLRVEMVREIHDGVAQGVVGLGMMADFWTKNKSPQMISAAEIKRTLWKLVPIFGNGLEQWVKLINGETLVEDISVDELEDEVREALEQQLPKFELVKEGELTGKVKISRAWLRGFIQNGIINSKKSVDRKTDGKDSKLNMSVTLVSQSLPSKKKGMGIVMVDNGVGFSADNLSLGVQPGKSVWGGNGMGLWAQKKLAERVGGDVLIDNEVSDGKVDGGKVTMVLPFCE